MSDMDERQPAQGIEATRRFDLKTFFLQWEWMLALLIVGVFAINTYLSPYFLNGPALIGATSTFLDKAFLVLPMVFVIILGDIDISAGSTVALSSVMMAVGYNAGLPMPVAMVLCLVTSTLCGLLNGVLIVKFKELSSVIVTLSTMIIYRGIAYVILEDQASGKFPAWFNYLGWGSVGPVPFVLIVFVFFAVFFALLLHKTTFGRRVYGMGSNLTACRFSRVRVDRIKIAVFAVTGLVAGVTALFLTSRMGSTRPNVALGYELDVITMVVMGGVSTAGGKGRMTGPIMAVFLVGYLQYGLGIVNVPSQALLIITGLLLVFAVMVPNISSRIRDKLRKRSTKGA
jgi:rhamnose transport system permease protein